MSTSIRIQDLPAEELAALLADDGERLSKEQVDALRAFIHDIGGIENATAAVEMLCDLERAA